MYYQEDLIEEVREKNDIVKLISGYVRLQRKGSNYFGLCPFHNEKSPSFSVSPQKQMYHCFGCGESGTVFTFLMKYENLTFPESVKRLADRAGMALPEVEYTGEQKRMADKRTALLAINKEAAIWFVRQLSRERGEAARAYLQKRELSAETIRQFGLGYAGMNSNDLYRRLKQKYSDELLRESGLFSFSEKGVYGKFFNRVMFPIMDVNSRVIGFGGRVMGDGQPKYLNSPETPVFDKSRNLYGLHAARRSRADYMILCEGYMDVIAMHQAGFSMAVASLGTSLTSGQASLLKRYAKEVRLIYDSDAAGVKAALRAIPILKEAGLSARVVNLKPHKDPDEFIKAQGAEAFRERLDQARNSFFFEIDVIKQNYRLEDPEQKTAFYQEVCRRLVDEFDDELERNNYTEAVCREFMLPLEGIKRQVNQLRLISGGRKEPVRTQPEVREQRRKKQEEAKELPQQLLLTWLIEDPGLYREVSRYIRPDDFLNPVYRRAAELLFGQLAAGKPNPAGIVDQFETEEEQKEAAKLFNASLLKEELSGKEKEQAVNDIVYRVKKDSLDAKLRTATTAAEMRDILGEQKELKNIRVRVVI
ncbi:MAG: DNA primase [Lachnospiraceae bacterium]|nr:DNA primase [Lachnospiraceae bacterium]